MKNLLIVSAALLCLHPLGLLADEAKVPDISKAFPGEKLFNQLKMDDVETYSYATDIEFGELKARFVKFLGKPWKEQKLEAALQKIADEAMKANGVNGHATFLSDAHPGVSVIISQTRQEIEGRKFLTTIVVSREPAN